MKIKYKFDSPPHTGAIIDLYTSSALNGSTKNHERIPMNTSLSSKRLSIKPMNTEDAMFIFELLNTDGWIQYIGDRNIHCLEDSLSYVQKIIDNPTINYWVVRLKKSDTPIGIISFIKRVYLDNPDIGFAFLPSFTGNGYAYESVKLVLEHVINSTGHAAILGITIAENIASIKLLKKLGLIFQKEIEVEKEKLQVYVLSKDKFLISEITRSFFSSFTNKKKSTPTLDLLRNISIPEILIVNRKESHPIRYTLDSFIEPRRKILTDGTLIEFEEREIYNETKIANNKATRFSEYEKSGILNGKKFTQRGHKLFQFIKVDQIWKICTVIWEDNENQVGPK